MLLWPDYIFRCNQSCFCGSVQFSWVPGGDIVRLLVNKMMLDNHVNVVGEGLVGRAAFTGNYHWILSQNYTKEFHPPEVLNEMHQQISAGMKTVQSFLFFLMALFSLARHQL